MEAVGQLTGGVAHDFNNLLTVIKSSTDLLRRPGLAEDRRKRYVDAIADTVDRAAKLTSQLLAFARRQALKPEVFDAGHRISSIADMLRTIVGSRVGITFEIARPDCFVEADASQFETAIVNMVVNARDAMGGEGTLRIRVDRQESMPTNRGPSTGQGLFVVVSLTDTGHGIAHDKIGQIFEPFFTTKEVGKGTGLGLSQVYGFAKQSGGDVTVESVVGRGTTFSLFFRKPTDRRRPPGPSKSTVWPFPSSGAVAASWSSRTISMSAISPPRSSRTSDTKPLGPPTAATRLRFWPRQTDTMPSSPTS